MAKGKFQPSKRPIMVMVRDHETVKGIYGRFDTDEERREKRRAVEEYLLRQ